ncbi:MAG: tetratricopeptide repeat protein [Nitrospirae bacterium]|nr:tetratricopeptide repeat protein [Nitrospirota bacterium]
MASDKNSIILNAQRLTAKGEIDKAIEAWRTLIAETPNDGNIYNTIGDLYLKKGAQSQAIEAFLNAGTTFQTAGFALKTIAVFKKIIKLDPGRMDVVLKLAEANAERGIVGNAVEDYLKVARHELKEGRVKAAIAVYRKIAALDPANPTIGVKLAELCQKEGLVSEAREELTRVATHLETTGKAAELQQIRAKLTELGGDGALPVPDLGSVPPPVDFPPHAPLLPGDRSGSGSINEATLVVEAEPLRIETSEASIAPAPAPAQPPNPPTPELSRVKSPSEFDETTYERVNDALTEADVYIKYGMIDKAVAHVQALAKQDSSNIEVQLKLRELFIAQGDTNAAADVCVKIASIYQLLGQDAEREAILDEAVALRPERVSERSQANPRAELSRSAAERSVRPEMPATVAGQSVDATQESDPAEALVQDLAEADFYFQQGFDDEAHRLFVAILHKVPDHPLAAQRLREISERAGRLGEPVSPVDPEATSQAMSRSLEETSLGSEIAVAGMEQGEAVQPPGETTKEEEYIDLIDALREDMERSLPPVEAEELSQELSAERELEGVFRKFQKGVQEQYGKEDYETHYNLGIAYREMGLLNEAIGEFRLALKSPDRAISATSMLATCYREKGQLARAEEILGEALGDPKYVGADGLAGLAYELGRIIEVQGRHEDALANYYRAKELEPDHKEARDRIAELEKRAAGSAPRAPAPTAIAVPDATVGAPRGVVRPIRQDKKKISYL